MSKFFTNFLRDESGASAAEYALIIAIVGVGIGAAALALGQNVQAAIGGAANEVDNCNQAGAAITGLATSAQFTGTECDAAPAAP
jgi:pilus assembly protein Flp/PilA